MRVTDSFKLPKYQEQRQKRKRARMLDRDIETVFNCSRRYVRFKDIKSLISMKLYDLNSKNKKGYLKDNRQILW
jgi:hypothetical protein